MFGAFDMAYFDKNDFGFFLMSSFLITLLMMNLLVAIMMGKFGDTMADMERTKYA
jgi:hypothetical protein